MAKTADDLRQEALALSTRDRAHLASELLASLDSEAIDVDEVDRLWSIETQRPGRDARVRRGRHVHMGRDPAEVR